MNISLDTPTLDIVDKVIRIFGWPALLGVIVWLVRTYDKGIQQLETINDDTKESRRMQLETLGAVNAIQSNHLAHLASDIKLVGTVQDRQLEVLTSIDKGIAVLAARPSKKR